VIVGDVEQTPKLRALRNSAAAAASETDLTSSSSTR
jgi:hypothetical protein